jgi:hypothetical protein
MLLQDAIEGDFGPELIFYQTNELKLKIPALPRPTLEEVRAKFPMITAIEIDTSPERAVSMALSTVTISRHNGISGKQYRRVIMMNGGFTLGYQHCRWLHQNQSSFTALSALRGKFAIHFPGIKMVDARGERHFPSLIANKTVWEEFPTVLMGGFHYGWDLRVATVEKVGLFGCR